MNAVGWTELAREGRTLEAIVAYRASAGVGLGEAKAAVERWVDVNLPPSVGYQHSRTIAGRVANRLADYTTRTDRRLAWVIRVLASSPTENAWHPSLLFAELPEDHDGHDLYVEITLPGVSGILRRETARELLSTDVRMVWIIGTDDPAVHVYTDGLSHPVYYPGATLDGGDVLPGFACKVSDLFA